MEIRHKKSPRAGASAGGRHKRYYTTGEMARLSKSTLRTVRFYEEAGILTPVGRTDGGHRLFERRELERLLFVSDLRAAGESLEDIRALLDAKRTATAGGEAADRAVALLEQKLDALTKRMDALARLRDDLKQSLAFVENCQNCTDGPTRSRAGEGIQADVYGGVEDDEAGGDVGTEPHQCPDGLFPGRCGECSKVAEAGAPPRGFRVLWELPTEGEES